MLNKGYLGVKKQSNLEKFKTNFVKIYNLLYKFLSLDLLKIPLTISKKIEELDQEYIWH